MTQTFNFKQELRQLLNKHSRDKKANTPDQILANYLVMALDAFDYTIKWRDDYQIQQRKRAKFQFDEASYASLKEIKDPEEVK